MLLHDSARAPGPRRVRIFAAEKGITLPTAQYDIVKGENLADTYRTKNPFGLIPALELDDGTVIGESVAICRYLEELHPEPALMGRTPLEKAQIEFWQRTVEFDAYFPVSDMFRNSFPGFAGRAVAGVPEPTEQIPALADRSRAVYRAFLEKLDRRLADHAHVAGEAFSIADITLLCAVDFARASRERLPETLGNLQRWYGDVSKRPSIVP